jgi:hypothetical protein
MSRADRKIARERRQDEVHDLAVGLHIARLWRAQAEQGIPPDSTRDLRRLKPKAHIKNALQQRVRSRTWRAWQEPSIDRAPRLPFIDIAPQNGQEARPESA